jgi:hypothetical protein
VDDNGDGKITEEDGLKATCIAVTDYKGNTVLLITVDMIGALQSTRVRNGIMERVNAAIASGEISGAEALSMGQYRVKGDFSLMLNWDKYFGSRQEVQTPNKSECTNMTILLLPWIVFWAAVSSHGFYGALICIAVCALIPLIFYKNRKTVYDILSGVLVTGLGIAVLLDVSVRWMLPVSYFLFGGMWCMSCLFKIPLTAHYSMNDYNGEEALLNPIFMKTNRILTLMWGVLYLLIGVGCLVTTGFAVVSYIAPALMGIFTVWFQRWYPAKVARGN